MPAAVEVLARAFRDNPLNQAVIGPRPERRLRSNRLGSGALLPVARAHGELWAVLLGERVAGVLVGTAPACWPLPPPPLGARLRCLWGQGLRVASRWGRAFDALEERHPREPHWYLATLGVDPTLQGRGLGGALLRAWLATTGAHPVYLETDRAENLPFYAREGFDVIERTRVLGAWVWCMQRPAPG